MKVLLIRPDEYAAEAEIENTLKAMQKIVGGNIEVFQRINDPVVFVMNEEGKNMGLDLNRALYDRQGNIMDVVAGTFFVCGVKDGDFISLSPEQMEKYKRQFFEPEVILKHDGKIVALKVDDPEPKKSIADQLKDGADQAAKDNAARPSPPKNRDKPER